MILEIDAGNTRIKWRLRKGAEVLDRGAAANLEELQQLELLQQKPQRLLVTSVRDSVFQAGLREMGLQLWGVEPQFARAQARQAGVVNAYADYDRMGADRWLAMLACFNRIRRACCVLDCGSAVTLDTVDQTGRHLGGYIVPGLRMQLACLLGNTAIRLKHEPHWGSTALGCSTEEAVCHGIVSMLSNWTAGTEGVREIAASGGLFLTGGDADILAGHLRSMGLRCELVPDLVLDGLAYALPEN